MNNNEQKKLSHVEIYSKLSVIIEKLDAKGKKELSQALNKVNSAFTLASEGRVGDAEEVFNRAKIDLEKVKMRLSDEVGKVLDELIAVSESELKELKHKRHGE